MGAQTNHQEGRALGWLLVIVALLALSGFFLYRYRDSVLRQPWVEAGLAKLGMTVSGAEAAPKDAALPLYHCPMHPEVVSDKPGKCPKCGMFLELIKPEGTAAPSPPATSATPTSKPLAGKAKYHCPMHPAYVSDRPGDCPICGMKLVPIEEAEATKGSGLPGHAPVKISPEMQQLIGVKTARAERRRVNKAIRAVGLVSYDETKLATVTLRYDGWLDQLFVNYTGQYVKKGEPLATIFSREALIAQNEHLIALDAVERARAEGGPDRLRSAQRTLDASREKLRLFDFTAEQVAELEKTRKPQTYITLHALISGYVTKRNIVKRSYVSMGQDLYEIADLSTVWVNVDVYEYEIPHVKQGQEATFSLSYSPGRAFKGKVAFIFPFLNNATRTVTVRLEFPNPNLELKPMMYGNVTIPVDLGEHLVVDDSAVMFTGTQEIVFVSLGDGHFEPRKVTLGPRSENHYVILDGLKEGESVVVGANFLVDSESRLKAALMGMSGTEAHKH